VAVISRRWFLAAGTAFIGGALGQRLAAHERQTANRESPSRPGSTRLVLLGTAGGPTPKVARAAPAQAVVVGDRVYLIDCGDGVARQLALAELPLGNLRALFITHQHSDHNAGYGPLFLVGWTGGIAAPVDTYGPPPLEKMTRLLLEAYDFDIKLRMADEGRAALAPLIRPHEITRGGEVFSDDRVRVTAAMNDHPPIEHSFAYRFDTADRSIVISGDTNYSRNVVALARGADVLVHEALHRPFWERPDAPATPEIRRHIVASHTDAEDVGRLANEAGVKALVLTHFVPSEPTGAVPDEVWLAAARKHFKGELILGRDLMEI
jgi:ribonuclease BN (tRNA processing enzyme)